MLDSNLIANIRTDLSVIVDPWLRFSPNVSSADSVFHSARFAIALLSKPTFRTCTNALERNCIEYVIFNCVHSAPDLGNRVSIRFVAGVMASLITNVLYQRKLKFSTWVVWPLLSGVLGAADILRKTTIEEMMGYLRAKLEELGVLNNDIENEIENIMQQLIELVRGGGAGSVLPQINGI
jgi:hypothetical protein